MEVGRMSIGTRWVLHSFCDASTWLPFIGKLGRFSFCDSPTWAVERYIRVDICGAGWVTRLKNLCQVGSSIQLKLGKTMVKPNQSCLKTVTKGYNFTSSQPLLKCWALLSISGWSIPPPKGSQDRKWSLIGSLNALLGGHSYLGREVTLHMEWLIMRCTSHHAPKLACLFRVSRVPHYLGKSPQVDSLRSFVQRGPTHPTLHMLPRWMKFDCLPKERDEQTHHLKSSLLISSLSSSRCPKCNHCFAITGWVDILLMEGILQQLL